MDHVADEIHKQPQEPITDDVGTNTEGFPDGSHDTSVLTSYVDHVATKVWAGEVIICLIISYLNKYLSFYLN